MTASVAMTGASPRSVDAPAGGKMRLTRELLSLHRGWIVIILLAMLGAIVMYVEPGRLDGPALKKRISRFQKCFG